MSNRPSKSLQLSILVTALVALALSGCKGDSDTPPPTEATPAEVAEPVTEAVEGPTEAPEEAGAAESGGLSAALAAAVEGAPAEQRDRAVPADANPERGRQQYETTCGFCHGAGGKGDGAAAAALDPGPGDWTDPERYGRTRPGEKAWVILQGVGGDSAMPGYASAMSESQVWELVAWLEASFGGG
jgi:mono/diheme cytochrome c family protein